jgi:hypothetical protein
MTWPGFFFHLLSLNSLALPDLALALARLSARPTLALSTPASH